MFFVFLSTLKNQMKVKNRTEKKIWWFVCWKQCGIAKIATHLRTLFYFNFNVPFVSADCRNSTLIDSHILFVSSKKLACPCDSTDENQYRRNQLQPPFSTSILAPTIRSIFCSEIIVAVARRPQQIIQISYEIHSCSPYKIENLLITNEMQWYGNTQHK